MTSLSRLVPVLGAAAAGVALTLSIASAAEAQRCEAPRLMLTVDRSSSMLGTLPEGITKWQAAVTAVDTIATGYEGRIDFGVQPFPYPNHCGAGRVELAIGAHTADQVVTALGPTPPAGGNWTPLTQTLEAALSDASMMEAGRSRALVLVTDGWQWCDPYDPATRFTPIDAVARLRDAGVTVYVVGFGAAVDSLTLNRAAVAAGTELPGCDASLDEPSAANHCYMQANSLTELSGALDAIAREITEELCDAVDNDCDGTIDEGFDVDADGVRTCDGDCDDATASTHPGAAELCNTIDDDCDGAIDPTCECRVGEERGCGTELGVCTVGRERCIDGAWGACEGANAGGAETCNGLDDDCDGAIDDGADASCAEGEVCTADGCVPLHPEVPEAPPVEDPTNPEEPGPMAELPPIDRGCACSAPGQSNGPASLSLATLALLGLAVLRRKR